MKKYAFLLTALLLLAACGKHGPQSARIEGEIEGLGDTTLYLYGTDGYYSRIDTLRTEGGKFSAKLQVDTVCIAALLLDGQEYPVVMDRGDKIRITGNAADLRALQVTGNEENEELTAFYRDVADKKANDRQTLVLAEEFIKGHPHSVASAYLVQRYFIHSPEPDYGKIKSLIGYLSGPIQDRPVLNRAREAAEEWEKQSKSLYAPYFSLPDSTGEKYSRMSEGIYNKYVLLTFWASFEKGHAAAVKELRDVYKQFKKRKDFKMIGVSLDNEMESWKQALRRDSLDGLQLRDEGSMTSALVQQYMVTELPTHVLIGPDGKLMDRKLATDSLGVRLKEVFDKADKEKKEKK